MTSNNLKTKFNFAEVLFRWSVRLIVQSLTKVMHKQTNVSQKIFNQQINIKSVGNFSLAIQIKVSPFADLIQCKFSC